MTLRILLLVPMLLCCGPLLAQQNPPERVSKFAALPAWSGIWEGQVSAESNSDAFGATLHEALAHPADIPLVAPPGVLSAAESFFINRTQLQQKPPYNAEWDRKYELRKRTIRATPASAVKPGSIMACTWDFPEIMDNPFDTVFEILVTPEQTLMLFTNGQARHLYTDRPHPNADDLWPTDLGNTVGRWEQDTLVVDTIERRAGPFIRIPHVLSPDLSENAHYTERIRMIDPDTLQDTMTIEDPERLVRPWIVTLKFSRVKDLDRLIPVNCSDSNRFKVVNGHLSIAPP
jgi:hypothetical protein